MENNINMPFYKLLLKGILNPATVMEKYSEKKSSYLLLMVSSIAYLLFFLQVGIDKLRVGTVEVGYVIKIALIGFVVGYLGVLLVSILIWMMTKLFKGDWSLNKVTGCIAISYSSTLVYMVCGILAQLILGWNTAITFGITGLLWSLFPVANSIKKITKNNISATVIITTISGILFMFIWSLILIIG
ncbi:YIP1 family protein [Clostridium vincentii]|uniref:Yip1 domain protein n=1 Tax=Clostridium vincentii TaxID=52704 RepID=A0A2T0BIJ2_9CLOT|nr:YIP1 family protein [Clostridium vincentii]PRR83694.1 Yip1 domain protein [Clostridium vincentii]